MAVSLPSKKESDVKCGAVQIYKLEQEHLESEAVLPLRLRPWVLCSETKQRELWGGQGEKINDFLPSGK